MTAKVHKIFLLFAAVIGVTSGLECMVCTWDAKNATTDHDCLGAPWKLEAVTCPVPTSPGVRYACQTNAIFTSTGGSRSLESLKRICATKHYKCNNACLEDIDYCWLCCEEDKCNSFPLRANVVYTSSAPELGHMTLHVTLASLFVSVNALLGGAFGY